MNTELLFNFLSAMGFLVIGIIAKTSSLEGWQPVKKYWAYFVIAGVLSLAYAVYQYL